MFRSLFAYVAFFLFLIVFLPILLIGIYVVREKSFIKRTTLILSEFTLWIVRKIIKLDYKIEGFDKIEKIKDPIFIASKHQSMLETIILFLKFEGKAVFVIKKELLRWPVIGKLMQKMGFIAIDRSQPIHALRKMTEETRKSFEQGLHVIVFPEGTRQMPGNETQYNEGIFLLYKKFDVPVATIALNTGCFWPKYRFIKKPGCTTLKVTKIIQTGLSREAFRKKLIQSIEEESRKIIL